MATLPLVDVTELPRLSLAELELDWLPRLSLAELELDWLPRLSLAELDWLPRLSLAELELDWLPRLSSTDMSVLPFIQVDGTNMMYGGWAMTHDVKAAVSTSTESNTTIAASRKRKTEDAADVGTKKHRHVRRAATTVARREYLKQLEY